jgi:transcriptional regulator with PAS, ATPase and Fis domain
VTGVQTCALPISDAKTQKKGIFELADTGTIFLDEIGDAAIKTQVKLLRVIEQKIFQRVGGTSDITIDVRIIAATNRPLERLVSEGIFREDLYYRLNVASLHIPPLRERGEDILHLTDYFLHEFNLKFQKHFQRLSDATKKMFLDYHWPGNVREVRNVIERALLLSDGVIVEPHHIELNRFFPAPGVTYPRPATTQDEEPSLYEMEKQALLHALEKTGYNQSQAARILKISRDTLRYRMKKYNISP